MSPGSAEPVPSPCFLTDERDRVQKKTFTKWVNKHLMKVGPSWALGSPDPIVSAPPLRQLFLLSTWSS